MVKTKFVTKISLQETLLLMRRGESKTIGSRDAKANVVHSTVSRIKKNHGFVYSVTEKGMVNEVTVTRIS